MNESIVDLGEAIIGAYYNKLNEWSALAELTFAKDDLPASFSMMDDVLRLEENWQEFTALVQTLQTDYLPQDLLKSSGTEALPPEQELQSPRFVKKVNNNPFASLSEANASFALSPGLKEQPSANKIESSTNFTLSESEFDFPEIEQTTSHIENRLPSFESPGNSFGAITNNISESSARDIFNMPEEDIFNLIQSQNKPNWNKPDLIPQGTSMQKAESKEPDDYAASIWTSPLQNLGDFATQITYPLKARDENIQSPRKVQPTENGTSRSSTYSAGLNSGQSDSQTNPFQSLVPEQSAAPDLTFNTPLISGSAEQPFKAGEIADFQPENQPFQSTTPPHTFLPDTDDLLDALTDRIVRDFRRYYP